MLRRPPTELDLKTEDLEILFKALDSVDKKAFAPKFLVEEKKKTGTTGEVRRRIGAPPPRVRMTPAEDTEPVFGDQPEESQSRR